ncbi:MAG: PadR family transcriptional regulator [Solirubrobacterales bacterium]|nr:PadR family transcriptional regulator [Solirubrobacterales bacterium]
MKSEAGWMRGASAPLRGALLGLVRERPGHSYDLAKRLNERIGDNWPSKDVYRLLSDLAAAGLVHVRREAYARREKIYFPTAQVDDALAAWLAVPTAYPPVRSSLYAKLAVARLEDASRLVVGLTRLEHDCLGLLAEPPSSIAQPTDWESHRINWLRDQTRTPQVRTSMGSSNAWADQGVSRRH